MNPSFLRGLLEARRAASAIKRSHSIPRFCAKDQGGERIPLLHAGGGIHAPFARQVNIARVTFATRAQLDSSARTAARRLHARRALQDSIRTQDLARAPRALVADTPRVLSGVLATPIARAAQDNT